MQVVSGSDRGVGWTAAGLLVIGRYAGGASPFAERYAVVLGDPAAAADLLTRSTVLEYGLTILLAGGWLGSHTALRFGARLIRPLLVAISLGMTGRLLWGYFAG